MSQQRIILLSLILLAFFLRVWQLPHLPPGLWYDEAYNAMDAVWMAETGQFKLFLVGNNGREPLWHYLLLASITLFGQTTFAVRWVGAMAGFLTVPLMYRFAGLVLAPFTVGRGQRQWLSLLAVAWLAGSWWHLLNSRAGFRPVLLPPLLMLSFYFWLAGIKALQPAEGRKSRAWSHFILAGLFLGLSQYTYLPARLTPLILAGLALFWTFQSLRAKNKNFGFPLPLKRFWGGISLTAAVSFLVFAPLGLFFLNHPETLSARTGDVVFKPDSLSELVVHLGQGVSLFFGAGHELYRHHLPGRAMLGWLEIPFFWIGLFSLLFSYRRRYMETQLLLVGLAVMWLPALLASPPVHALRPIGLLPFYYLVVTLGLYVVYTSLQARYRSGLIYRLLPLAPALLIILNGFINSYDYFRRWANHPEVYQEYNGPLVDLTRQLIPLTQTTDIIIPFHLYLHPTTRYLLGRAFPERNSPLPSTERPRQILLIPDLFQLLYVGNIPSSPALVLLSRDQAGRGAAYVSRPPRAAEQTTMNELLAANQSQLNPFRDRLNRTVAQLLPLPASHEGKESGSTVIEGLFETTPLRSAQVEWPNWVRLEGYEITPVVTQPGQALTLNLYWHSLTETSFEYRLFLQLIDETGQPLNQWEGKAVPEDMYRWRPEGLLPTQHHLWLGPDVPPGAYLVRLGFFDDVTGQRLPLQIPGSTAETDQAAAFLGQVQLGLFYVSTTGRDPRQPASSLSASFADAIRLIGVTLPPLSLSDSQPSFLPVTFHWQALQPTSIPYTAFLQLLDAQGQVVSSWDRQPLSGLYPTNLWSPGEIIVDTFQLPLPAEGLSSGSYRLITGFYDFESGQRLPAATEAGTGDSVEIKNLNIAAPD